jgi:hypothetical protein
MTTRTPTARAATRTRIWPGPECLRERPSRSVMRPTRGSYYPAAVLRLVDGGVWIDGCVYDSRHVMPGVTIALAWEAVRARRERFLAWLGRWGASWAVCLRNTAIASMSPEQCFRAAAVGHPDALRSFALACDHVSVRAYVGISRASHGGDLAAVIDAYIAGPEWAAPSTRARWAVGEPCLQVRWCCSCGAKGKVCGERTLAAITGDRHLRRFHGREREMHRVRVELINEVPRG